MDPLSVTASSITILEVTTKVVKYLIGLKHFSEERSRCAIEASTVFSLLTKLHFHLDGALPGEPLYVLAQELNAPHGPLVAFKRALEQIVDDLTTKRGFEKTTARLSWNFSKRKIDNLLYEIRKLIDHIHNILEIHQM